MAISVADPVEVDIAANEFAGERLRKLAIGACGGCGGGLGGRGLLRILPTSCIRDQDDEVELELWGSDSLVREEEDVVE